MCTLVGVRAARACSACARPISPPSAVTAALLDMFCGLNGRTFSPRFVKARARPATISDLPTSEPVPWNMRARAGTSVLDPRLRLHASGEMMLYERHLGDEVGRRHKLRLRIATRDHDMQTGPASRERPDDRRKIKLFVAQRDVELVEDDQREARIGHELQRFGPGTFGCGDVPSKILGFPGKALTHGEPGDLIAEGLQR